MEYPHNETNLQYDKSRRYSKKVSKRYSKLLDSCAMSFHNTDLKLLTNNVNKLCLKKNPFCAGCHGN